MLLLRLLPILILACFLPADSMPASDDFLTDKEIDSIQLNQEIQQRVKLYLEFAALRLKTAEDKLNGVEPVAGDPFELLRPEDLLDAYYRILRSVMMNLDDAYQRPDPRMRPKVRQALKTLKGSTEKALPQLEILKRIAEEKKNEELWELVNKAIDVTNGAHEGAEAGLAKEPEPSSKKKSK